MGSNLACATYSLWTNLLAFSPAEWGNTATRHIWSLPSQSGHSAWHTVMPSVRRQFYQFQVQALRQGTEYTPILSFWSS